MDILEKANLRRKELLEELRNVDDFIAMYHELAKLEQPRVAKQNPPEGPRIDARQSPNEQSTSKRELIENSVEYFLTVHQPQQTDALLEKLKESNIDVGGQNPLINLSSYLSRSGKFVNRRKDGGWFLNDQEKAPDGGNQTGA